MNNINTINRRQALAYGAAGFAGTSGLLSSAAAQTKGPPELAKILVPFAIGGTLDLIARQLAQHLRGETATTLIVENKSGAAGRIAVDALRQAPADGLTLAVHAGGIQSMYPHTYKQLSYDPFNDVVPVSLTNHLEFGLAVGPAVPDSVKNLHDYIAWIKVDPKRANIATPGAGTPLHFLAMLLGRAIGVDVNPVHYRGTGAALPELMGGQVPALSTPLHDALQQVVTGKVRILATSGTTRNRRSPQVATYAESGFPQLTSGDWYAVYVSGKTPPALQAQLSAQVRKALAAPALVATFNTLFIEPAGSTPAEAMKLARADYEHWGRIVKAVGYTPE
ncbi:MAG: tripartite tricarboxylate transporter substrate-binding protein [Burkholderiaceae bacterium]|nr:tripartite tricarboxylate transporter substrate-binding protein [Burkholderiaceae bacterium]